MSDRNYTIDKVTIKTRIDKFLEWKNKNGYKSYDQYDLWSTKYGRWSKSKYYKSKITGSFFVAPVFIADIVLPQVRYGFNSKKRFPIADAHLIMGHINMYKHTLDVKHLQEAESIGSDLMKSSIPGYSGHCWGYPFDWMTKRGLWTGGIPLITTVGYCFEAYLMLYDVTGKKSYLDIAQSVFLFALNDIKDVKLSSDIYACSYSPQDESQIINANAYRSFILTEGSVRFKNAEAQEKAKMNINFILTNQCKDGSWFYAVDEKKDHFVDNFHTCFVLKNLFKINRVMNDERITLALKNGFRYYKTHLLGRNGVPLPFAKLSRFNTVKVELYDFAEGISLCLSMQELDKNAGIIAVEMINTLLRKFQKKDGSFITRINILGIRNTIPFLRWPQAQLFYALTNYLQKLN